MLIISRAVSPLATRVSASIIFAWYGATMKLLPYCCLKKNRTKNPRSPSSLALNAAKIVSLASVIEQLVQVANLVRRNVDHARVRLHGIRIVDYGIGLLAKDVLLRLSDGICCRV